MIDYHVHTVYSGDAVARMREMCARAVEIGIAEIAFTEHVDFLGDGWSNKAFDYPVWIDEISAARDEFAGKLIIHAGAEVDYRTDFYDKIASFLDSHAFDYLIGSAHYADGVILEEHENYFPSKSEQEAYSRYFKAALSVAESGLFDTLGHMDLCKRYGSLYYGKFHPEKYEDEVSAVISAVIEHDMVIEINTSGLRQAPEETYPGPEMLKLYKNLGGKQVTLGSDSHRVHQLGQGLDVALKLATEAGLSIRKVGMLK